MRYRRAVVAGGTYFFTQVTEQRRPILTVPGGIDCLRAAFREIRQKHPFRIEAIVVLPDHLHCIWTLPENDGDYAGRWRLIKTWCTKHWPAPVPEASDATRRARGERGLWQRRYWEHTIRDERDFQRHFDYVHYNPVKHGYAASPATWPYSSFARAVRAGIYEPDWTCTDRDLDGIGCE
ncbi:REP-associated tyrosine transposase [Thiococcus pfennigii]|jgi:putative transposase|uniref:REP-associated tyrosine transposase n=1 Tax=Thiococcus pfennigii TaxID=1057 RepID=UPI0019045563|nr:transposase [Thiococcus pfennigii]MBK1732708.1 transposase [Thiococcus pfennigii]